MQNTFGHGKYELFHGQNYLWMAKIKAFTNMPPHYEHIINLQRIHIFAIKMIHIWVFVFVPFECEYRPAHCCRHVDIVLQSYECHDSAAEGVGNLIY